MRFKNTSDHIEAYIKAILDQAGIVELQRSQLADTFQVVPSQINYVIKTRFSIQQGYHVISKRGGGGFIRIERVPLRADPRYIEELLSSLSDQVSVREVRDILSSLVRDELLTEREQELLLTMLSKEALDVGDVQVEGRLRGRFLRQLLNRMRFESERN